jgi:hypothetical protein
MTLYQKWLKIQPLLRDIYPEYGEKTKIHATPDVKGFADSLLYFQNWLNADFEKNIQESELSHENPLGPQIIKLYDYIVG